MQIVSSVKQTLEDRSLILDMLVAFGGTALGIAASSIVQGFIVRPAMNMARDMGVHAQDLVGIVLSVLFLLGDAYVLAKAVKSGREDTVVEWVLTGFGAGMLVSVLLYIVGFFLNVPAQEVF